MIIMKGMGMESTRWSTEGDIKGIGRVASSTGKEFSTLKIIKSRIKGSGRLANLMAMEKLIT